MTESGTELNHYARLRVKPTASPQEIRRAYRDLSKLYHPDTTQLPSELATEKFQVLNDAYATLSNPEKRLAYDYSIGISRVAVMQAPSYLNRPASERKQYERSHAYLDPTDRPLSPGEIFALFILGITFVGCLVLVVAIGWSKGDLVRYSAPTEATTVPAAPTTADPAPYVSPVSPSTPDIDADPAPQAESLPDQTMHPEALPVAGISTKII